MSLSHSGAVRPRALAVPFAISLLLASGAVADETLLCHVYVRTAPFIISAPGHYCLVGDVKTSQTTGNAITVAADDVVLDLNGFSLDGSAAGTGTRANGIFTFDRRRITVRNGTVRGFFDGIQLGAGGAGVSNLTVERVRVDRTAVGIAVRGLGGGHVVRDNVVTNSGGSTVPGETNGVGISVYGTADVSGNVVMNTFGDSPVAFDLSGGGQIVSGNRVIGSGSVGFSCDPPAGQVLRDNVVLNAPIPYTGSCTLVGATNHP
jgi:hypothetical protein